MTSDSEVSSRQWSQWTSSGSWLLLTQPTGWCWKTVVPRRSSQPPPEDQRSDHEVGPGTLTLADGNVIDVESGTPGGSYCSLLGGPQMPGSSCLIVGQFQPGTTTAAWFATELGETIGDYGHVVRVVPMDGLNAAIPAGDVLAGVPINPNAEMVNCGPGNLRESGRNYRTRLDYYGVWFRRLDHRSLLRLRLLTVDTETRQRPLGTSPRASP